jgi:hypothetical protein
MKRERWTWNFHLWALSTVLWVASCGNDRGYDGFYTGRYFNSSSYGYPSYYYNSGYNYPSYMYPINNYPTYNYPNYSYPSYNYPNWGYHSSYSYPTSYYPAGYGYYPSSYSSYYSGIPIRMRPYTYRYQFGENEYDQWPSRYALTSYLDCRRNGNIHSSRSQYRCAFPDSYGTYETIARYLDEAMEALWGGRTSTGRSYISYALNALPAGDPLVRTLEQVDPENQDVSEYQPLIMRALGDVAMKMATQ